MNLGPRPEPYDFTLLHIGQHWAGVFRQLGFQSMMNGPGHVHDVIRLDLRKRSLGRLMKFYLQN